MRTLKTLSLVGVLALGLAQAYATPIRIDFSSVSGKGAGIEFNGITDTFRFMPITNNFRVTDTTSGNTDTVGLLGTMEGVWGVGPISSLGGGVEEASVTGVGKVYITDEDGDVWSGDLSFGKIRTFAGIGGINPELDLNISNLTYTDNGGGADNPDLLSFLGNRAIEVITFQFIPAKSLTQLTTEAKNTTSFSGSISAPVPDFGSTMALMFLGLGFLGIGRLSFRK
jgi:hypothetical protein